MLWQRGAGQERGRVSSILGPKGNLLIPNRLKDAHKSSKVSVSGGCLEGRQMPPAPSTSQVLLSVLSEHRGRADWKVKFIHWKHTASYITGEPPGRNKAILRV